nr:MAG TPA: hypothetical protein [Caudoviricetes sp.]
MIVSNRRYEITLHGDLPPLVFFYIFHLRFRLFTFGNNRSLAGEIRL